MMYKRKGLMLIECAIVLAIIAIVGAAALKCAEGSSAKNPLVPPVKTSTTYHEAERVVFNCNKYAVREGYILTFEGKRYLSLYDNPLVELAPATMTAELGIVK